MLQRDGGEGGDEARAAEELGDEDGGVGLRLRAVDPLDAGAEHAGVAAPLAQDAAAVAAHLPSYISRADRSSPSIAFQFSCSCLDIYGSQRPPAGRVLENTQAVGNGGVQEQLAGNSTASRWRGGVGCLYIGGRES